MTIQTHKMDRLVLRMGLFVLMACQAALAAPPAAGAAAAAPNVMALETSTKYPEVSSALKLVQNSVPDLAEYLKDPDSVCTFFIPTNQALTNNFRWLGKYAGKAAQNATMARSTINYHVVPGTALTADDIGKTEKRALTRANQTLYFFREGNKPMIYFRPDLPLGLNKTNIKAGKCIVHTIDMAMVPPSYNEQIQAWLEEVGNMPATRPKARWAPEQEPLPDSIEAGGAKIQDSSATAATPSGAPAAAPARSGSSGSSASVLVMLSAAAAAGFVLM